MRSRSASFRYRGAAADLGNVDGNACNFAYGFHVADSGRTRHLGLELADVDLDHAFVFHIRIIPHDLEILERRPRSREIHGLVVGINE